MKERPILFSAPMVRAILYGSKTQTRRAFSDRMITLMRAAAECGEVSYFLDEGRLEPNDLSYIADFCPYGKPGDRLWVRETWGVVSNDWDDNGALIDWTPDRPATAISEMPFGSGYYSGHVIYAADGSYEWAGDDDGGGEPRSAWHPSIHMPRAASRILLEIVSVRVERLQDISEGDAIAEGCGQPATGPDWQITKRWAYRALWNDINGADAWDVNPWVWVVEFKRVAP